MWMLKNAFNSGELSPILRGRYDFDKYGLGCSYLSNFIVLPQGGVSNRPGTRFIDTVPGACRLVPFNYSTTDSYILVFLEGAMQVVKGAAFVAAGSAHYEIASPYAATDLPLLRYAAQTGNTMVLTHPLYPPHVLKRIADNDWTLAPLALVPAVAAPTDVTAVYSTAIADPSAVREYTYIVTASIQGKGESYARSPVTVTVDSPWNPGSVVNISWTPVAGADAYHIYKNSNGTYGWIGSVRAVNELTDASNASRSVLMFKTSDGTAFTTNPLSSSHKWAIGNSLAFAADRYATLAASADYALSGSATGAFTIDLWVGLHADPTDEVTLAEVPGCWRLWIAADNAIHFKWTGGPDISFGTMTVIPAGQFHYVRVRRDSTAGHNYYIAYGENNGAGSMSTTESTTVSSAVAIPSVTASLYLGAKSDRTKPFTGEIEDFRIRWVDDSARTVPTAVPVLDATTKVLCHFDGAYLIDDAINPSAEDTPVENRDPFASEDGYPACSAFYDQRLMLARTSESPQTVWGSRTGDPYNFGTSLVLKPDDAVTIPIASRELAEIHHLVPLDTLLAFTSSSYFTLSGAGNGAITPTDIIVRPKGDSPVSPKIPPLVVGSMVLFANPTAKVVNGLYVAADNGVFQEQELSILSEHLLRKHPIKEWGFQKFPTSTAWCVCTDGTGLVFTIHREHQVFAWGRFTTHEDDTLESVACISGPDQDMVYVCAKRGGDYCVERMEPRLPDDASLAFFVDSGLDYSGSAVSTVSGLEHLEGREVAVVGDGAYLGLFTVASGEVVLGGAYSKIVAGLPYLSEAKSLPFNLGQAKGPGGQCRISRVAAQVTESRGGSFYTCEDRIPSYSETPEVALVLRTDEAWGDPQQMATGVFELSLHGQWLSNAVVGFRQSLPMPLTVNAIALDIAG